MSSYTHVKTVTGQRTSLLRGRISWKPLTYAWISLPIGLMARWGKKPSIRIYFPCQTRFEKIYRADAAENMLRRLMGVFIKF